jgi:hypothetical protein
MQKDDKSYDNRTIKYPDDVSCQWAMCKQLQDKYNKAIEFIRKISTRSDYDFVFYHYEITRQAESLLELLSQQEPADE